MAASSNLNSPSNENKSAGFSLGLLLILSLPPLFWAGNFIVGRAVSGSVGPMTLVYGRWVLALLVLLPFAWRPLMADWQRQRALYWEHRWRILGLSVLGIAAFNSLVYWGLRTTTATNGILLQSIIPILIVLFGALFYGQRLRPLQALGLAVSFVGVFVIILHGQWQRLLMLAFGQGDLLVFLAVVSWSLYTLWLRAIPVQINRMALLVVQIGLGLVVLTPLFVWESVAGMPAQWTWKSIAALLYIGIFPSVLAYLLYNYGVAKAGAAKAGQFIHLMPVFGTILSMLLLGERLQPYHVAGIAAIVLGIVLAGRRA